MAKGRRVAYHECDLPRQYTSFIKGKRYDVIEEDVYSFHLISEHGNECYLLKKGCSFLFGKGQWILETETE